MGSTHARMTIEWSVAAGQVRAITMALHSLSSEVRPRYGCIGCSVATDITSLGSIRYTEEWQAEENLRDRLQADSFSQLIALMETSGQPPRVEFALARGTRGMDFVEEVRGARIHE